MNKKALIIGCGIGGPTVAMALQRAGIDPVIYEARPRGQSDEAGLFLNASVNGLAVLRTLDAHEAVLAAGFPTSRMTMWSGSGKRLGEVPNGGELPDGTVSTTLERGKLQRVLREQAEQRGIPIEYDKRLIGAEANERGVRARFVDGSEATGDLLIGVDGVHSAVRQLVDPSCPPPRFTGQLGLGGITRGSDQAPTPGAYHMIFGQRAFFGYSVTAAGDVYWFANLAASELPAREQLRDGEHWRQTLLAAFEGDHGPALAMIGATPEVIAYPIYDLPSVRRWHRDSMIVLGDAAHATSPSSGQGAALALEDALELARCLRDHDDTQRAFVAYEKLRRARVERVVKESARISNNKLPGPVGRFFRDLMMPMALKKFATDEAYAWLYGHQIDFAESTRSA